MEIQSKNIKETILRHGWKRLLLAVSGGLDSMCLAHYFIQNQKVLGIEWLGIAHVHHGLRETTADLDAELVQNFAEKHNVPFFWERLDGESLRKGGSLEENARKARYAAFLKIITQLNARFPIKSGMTLQDASGMTLQDASGMTLQDASGKTLQGTSGMVLQSAIVTAHHAGDQAETVYLRLRRGVTLAGLRGIQNVRPFCQIPAFAGMTNVGVGMTDAGAGINDVGVGMTDVGAGMTNAIVLYRPFISINRSELKKYALENHIAWREDESNADTKFARNQVRHASLPHLEQAIPGAASQLCRIAAKSANAYEKIIDVADKLFNSLVVSRTDCLTLDTKKGKVSLQNGMDEIFRLWLDRQGYRFPVGAFKGKALLNDIRNMSYRTRFIEKNRNIIRICEKRATTDI